METTLAELDDLVTDYFGIRREIDELESLVSALNLRRRTFEKRFQDILIVNNLNTFKGSAGTIALEKRFSVKGPATIEDKKLFFEYLQHTGQFWSLASVNSQSLNRWYKDESIAAGEMGSSEMSIPGLSQPTEYKYIKATKSRRQNDKC